MHTAKNLISIVFDGFCEFTGVPPCNSGFVLAGNEMLVMISLNVTDRVACWHRQDKASSGDSSWTSWGQEHPPSQKAVLESCLWISIQGPTLPT